MYYSTSYGNLKVYNLEKKSQNLVNNWLPWKPDNDGNFYFAWFGKDSDSSFI